MATRLPLSRTGSSKGMLWATIDTSLAVLRSLNLQAVIKTVGEVHVYYGSTVPYGGYIEYGSTGRSGRYYRKAKMLLTNATLDMQGGMSNRIYIALKQLANMVMVSPSLLTPSVLTPIIKDALREAAEYPVRKAQRFAPVFTGVYAENLSVFDVDDAGYEGYVRAEARAWMAQRRIGVEAMGFDFWDVPFPY